MVPALVAPSPQFQLAVCVSAVPGSVNETLVLIEVLISVGAIGAPVIAPASGATLLIVATEVYSLTPPSLSMILPLTVGVPLSFVGQEALLLEPKLP